MQHDVVIRDATGDLFLSRQIYRLGHIAQVFERGAGIQSAGDLDGGLLTHAVGDHVGRRVTEQAFFQLVAPIVVVGDTTEGGFDTAEKDGHIRIELFQDLGIDDGGVFRTHVVTSVGAVDIFGTQTAGGGVLVDHRVHTTWRDAEEQPGTPELLEVTEVAVPVGLGYDGHPITCRLQGASDDGCSKRGMIDVGITREQDDIHVIPSPEFQLLLRRRQEIC